MCRMTRYDKGNEYEYGLLAWAKQRLQRDECTQEVNWRQKELVKLKNIIGISVTACT